MRPIDELEDLDPADPAAQEAIAANQQIQVQARMRQDGLQGSARRKRR